MFRYPNLQAAYSPYYKEDPTADWRLNWALRMASVGYYSSYNATLIDGSFEPQSFVKQGNTLNVLLNNARASYEGGLFQFKMVWIRMLNVVKVQRFLSL